MINGDPADPNAAVFKEGAHNGFEEAGVEIAKEYDTPGWSAENAQREMQQAITALGNNGFAGIYAANDDTGGGAIAAMKGAGINPEERPITGQDATVAGLQRILAGQQYMTVYKAIEPEADDQRRNRDRPGRRRRSRRRNTSPKKSNNGKVKVPVGAARTGRRDQRQHQEHGGRGRIRHRLGTLHQRIRVGLQGSGDLGAEMEQRHSAPRAGGREQAIRPGPGSGPGRLRGQRRRGRRPRRRQRRRQVDAGEDDRRDLRGRRRRDPLRRGEVSISRPQDATELGIATVYQDLALCDNLDVVANLFLGQRGDLAGHGLVSRQLDEARWSTRPPSCSPTWR